MKIKVGIIGCGSITRFRHAPEYKANPHVSGIVFYDRNPERARALADEFAGEIAQSVEELLQDPGITAISDCSSNEYHHIFTTQALQQGKHVLCEKPIALTLEHAREMLAAAEKSGKKLMIDHNQRFTKGHQRAKKLLQDEELGKILTFKTSFGHQGPEHWGYTKSNATWFFKKERSGLGVAGDLGIHKIDLLHYLLGDKIKQVSAFQGALSKVDENGKPIEVCDNIVCNLKTEEGRLGTASFSWSYYGEEDNSTIIYCEEGIVKLYHHPDYQMEVIMKNGERILYELEAMQTNDNQTNTGVIDHFVDCIVQDREPLVTGKDAIDSLAVILAMMEAAESENVIRVHGV